MELTIRTRPGVETVDWEPARKAARNLLAQIGRTDAEVSVLLTDDAEIRRLNRDWRQIDRATDVLSWPQEDEDILGDVAISLDTARRQAAAREWSVADEVALLLVHGMLHLIGHEDETESGARSMQAIETRILGRPLEKVGAAEKTDMPADTVK